MPGKPSFQFYPGDWLKDPNLTMCSCSTRGIWIDWICRMHELDHCGKLTATLKQLAILGRCTPEEATFALDELRDSESATVTVRNKKITVINRRMTREFKERKANADRQKRHRGKGSNDDVTYEVTEKSRSPSSSSSSTSSSSSKKDPPTPHDSEVEIEFVQAWNSTGGIRKNLGDTLSEKRLKSFRVRIRDLAWDWRAALAMFPLKCFQGDDDPWHPTVDWFLKPDSVQDILEGKYDWTKSDGRTGKRLRGAGEDYQPGYTAEL